ncbi:MAG TPA: TPM domain-containing protein, partial [Candidatus Paceibacterota bacterium]
MRRALAVALLASFAIAGVAFAYSSPGKPSGYVNDFAHVLKPEAVSSLNADLAAFEASTSNEVAVVTVPNMGGDYVEHYAVQLFQEWGIGKKNKDNGVLLLLAVDEHKIRIEVGYGLEGALPDSVAQSIINNDLTPKLKAGDYDSAVTSAVADIERATQGEYTAEAGSGGSNDALVWAVVGPLFALIWLASIFARSKSWWAGGVVGVFIGIAVWLFVPLAAVLGIVATIAFGVVGLLLDFVVSRGY